MGETATALRTIDRDELKRKLDRGDPIVLLETLSLEQFRHSHLPGARHAPPERLRELAPALVPNKDAEVVTYCAGPTCQASVHAAHELLSLGYSNVRHYAGGKQDWASAGLPMEHGG